MARRKWEDIDWVELGCRGWDIDETGAGLCDEAEVSYVHLDGATLDILSHGSPEFLYRALADLSDAGALYWFPMQRWVVTPGQITRSCGSLTMVEVA